MSEDNSKKDRVPPLPPLENDSTDVSTESDINPDKIKESEGFEDIAKFMPADVEEDLSKDKPFEDFEKEKEELSATSKDNEVQPIDRGERQPKPEPTRPQFPDETEKEIKGTEEEDGKKEEAPKKASEVNYVTSDVIEIKIGDDSGLTNKDPTLKNLMIGCGWEVRSFEGDPPDLDLSCFLLNKDNMTRQDEDFVFYNNRQSLEGEMKHLGDSRTGAGEGDDEMMEVNLQALSFDISALMLVLSIHDGEVKEQDFSIIKDLFLRIVNKDSGQELCKLIVPDSYLQEHKGYAMKLGQVFRDGPKWRFHADTETINKGGLRIICKEYGILTM